MAEKQTLASGAVVGRAAALPAVVFGIFFLVSKSFPSVFSRLKVNLILDSVDKLTRPISIIYFRGILYTLFSERASSVLNLAIRSFILSSVLLFLAAAAV